MNIYHDAESALLLHGLVYVTGVRRVLLHQLHMLRTIPVANLVRLILCHEKFSVFPLVQFFLFVFLLHFFLLSVLSCWLASGFSRRSTARR